MKFLLVTSNYLCDDATGNCIRNLVRHLSKHVNIEVAHVDPPKIPTPENGIKVHIINTKLRHRPILRNTSLSYKEYVACEMREKGFVKCIFEISKNMWSKLVNRVIVLYNDAISPNLSYIKLKKIFKNGNYDGIMSVCMPFSNHILSYKLKRDFPDAYWIANYYDPYSFSYSNIKRFKKVCDYEDKLLAYADKIILTSVMYEEFKQCKLKRHLDRSVALEFPNLIYHDIDKNNTTIKFDKKYINCVFTGYLYAAIRNPRYLFELLNKTDKDIRLYVVGGYGNKKTLNIDFYSQLLGDRLKFISFVPLEESFRIMNDADILINISNAVSNQLPSKLFDYFSIGKPVVNFHKFEKCLSIPYTEKYPLALNIYEKDEIDAADVENFEKFCRESKGKKLEFSIVEEIYKTSTPEYVAKMIVETEKPC